MDNFFGGLGAPVMLLAGAFFGITALLWFLLPFSVFGIKARLDQEIELLARIEEQLKSLNRRIGTTASHAPIAPEPGETEPATPDSAITEASAAPRGDQCDTVSAPPRETRWQRPG